MSSATTNNDCDSEIDEDWLGFGMQTQMAMAMAIPLRHRRQPGHWLCVRQYRCNDESAESHPDAEEIVMISTMTVMMK